MSCGTYRDEKCFISAYDAATGKQLGSSTRSRRVTIQLEQDVGNLPDRTRAGGETWITGSYDPDLIDLLGHGSSEPWMTLTRGTEGDALYSSSTWRSIG